MPGVDDHLADRIDRELVVGGGALADGRDEVDGLPRVAIRRPVTSAHAEIVIGGLPSDGAGRHSVAPAGQVVLAVSSPEALAAEPDEVRRVIDRAGGGFEPLVILVEEAESVRQEELMAVLAAVVRAPRSVILRVMHAPD
ncbi:MAG TPA: hypothetical protein VFN55_04385 [Solirubrobacteraceae bacterium]|nr:hypothetical protein [Solirubrobacteraceae bacterium]